MTNIVPVQPQQPRSIEDLHSISQSLAKSGFFSDAADASKAFVKVLAGQELGIPAFAAMTGIHIIKGKPVLGADVIASLIKGSGRYDYRIAAHTDEICTIKFYERRNNGLEEVGESTFTAADAKRAGTQNMGKFPRNMLFARAISNGQKWHCPEVTAGMTVYSEGEIVDDAIPLHPVTIDTSWKDGTAELKRLEGAETQPKNEPTQAQKRLFKTVQALGWQTDQAKDKLAAIGYASSAEVTEDNLSEVIAKFVPGSPLLLEYCQQLGNTQTIEAARKLQEQTVNRLADHGVSITAFADATFAELTRHCESLTTQQQKADLAPANADDF